MSVQFFRKPFNRTRFGTVWIASPIYSGTPDRGTAGAVGLFLLAATATLTIWMRDPFVAWGYECCAFALSAVCCRRAGYGVGARVTAGMLAVAGISLWGFVQLALGATVYRNATCAASLRWAALGAAAWAAAATLQRPRLRMRFLRGFACFSFVLSILAVLEYYTSSGKVFWIFASGYPDAWGPFLSRNNFAQFLELGLPVALWLAATEAPFTIVAATMLAAGLASASRAGATILLLETIAVLGLLRRGGRLRHRMPLQLAAATAVLAAIAGAGQLGRRIFLADPFEYRGEMASSALAMIAEHPWRGFGLGTFSTVYPAYATFDAGAVVEHAHNDWLEWASEGGLPFAVLWAGLAVAMTRVAIRSVWGIGVPAVFLHALVDYPFARLGVAAWVFVLIGMLGADAFDKREAGDESTNKRDAF